MRREYFPHSASNPRSDLPRAASRIAREREKPRGARSRRTWRRRWKRKRKRVCGRKTERTRERTHGVRVRERVVYGRGKRVTEGRRIARKRRRRRRGRERTLQNVQPV